MNADNLWVIEEYTNETEGHRFGSSDAYETFTNNRGELFRSLQKEFGACKSKIYIGEGNPIGWYFERIEEYTDTGKPYLRGVWAIVLKCEPETEITYSYA